MLLNVCVRSNFFLSVIRLRSVNRVQQGCWRKRMDNDNKYASTAMMYRKSNNKKILWMKNHLLHDLLHFNTIFLTNAPRMHQCCKIYNLIFLLQDILYCLQALRSFFIYLFVFFFHILFLFACTNRYFANKISAHKLVANGFISTFSFGRYIYQWDVGERMFFSLKLNMLLFKFVTDWQAHQYHR